jgi:hypothetical protein
MDGTGAFSSGPDGDTQVDADGVDTAISVSGDERRMHVRAYNHWVSLLNGRAYPSIEDLEPENLQDFGPNSVLLDFTAGIENPAIAYLGPKLREACELDSAVASVSEIPRGTLLSRLTDHYMQIIANRAPIGFEAEFMNEAGQEIMYRGILMPFSSDDDTIDFIYGVINWKEAADGALSESLIEEVSRALAAPPVERTLPRSPSWADGPTADTPEPSFAPRRSDVLSVADDEDDDVMPPVSADDVRESLADWLAAARSSADAANHADVRSRTALYRALGEAYDFALTAEERAEEYEELLADCNLNVQPRAPMTPIVKLVFGTTYDKTRLAEYAQVLMHGKRTGLRRGEMTRFVEGYQGGLKAIVQAERRFRTPKSSAVAALDTGVFDKARSITPRGLLELAGSDEFVILVARRIDPDHVAMIGHLDADDKAIQKALQAVTQATNDAA